MNHLHPGLTVMLDVQRGACMSKISARFDTWDSASSGTDVVTHVRRDDLRSKINCCLSSDLVFLKVMVFRR